MVFGFGEQFDKKSATQPTFVKWTAFCHNQKQSETKIIREEKGSYGMSKFTTHFCWSENKAI